MMTKQEQKLFDQLKETNFVLENLIEFTKEVYPEIENSTFYLDAISVLAPNETLFIELEN